MVLRLGGSAACRPIGADQDAATAHPNPRDADGYLIADDRRCPETLGCQPLYVCGERQLLDTARNDV